MDSDVANAPSDSRAGGSVTAVWNVGKRGDRGRGAVATGAGRGTRAAAVRDGRRPPSHCSTVTDLMTTGTRGTFSNIPWVLVLMTLISLTTAMPSITLPNTA